MRRKKKTYSLSTTKKRLSIAKRTSVDENSVEIRRDFIDKFTLCDVTCKSVLEYYKKSKGTYKPGEYVNLNMKMIPAAMKSFDLDIPLHVLNGIFGGSGQYKKRGTKSAKKLRDGIVHAMNKDDVAEVVNRNEELNRLMDNFLSFFAN